MCNVHYEVFSLSTVGVIIYQILFEHAWLAYATDLFVVTENHAEKWIKQVVHAFSCAYNELQCAW